MPNARSCLCFTLAALLLARTADAEVTPEAQPILERVLAAAGGRAAFDSVRSMRLRGRVSMAGLNGVIEAWSEQPDRQATEIQLGPFRILEGFDGSVAWRTDPGSGKPVRLDGKDLEEARAGAYFDNERWLVAGQEGGSVSLAGTETDSAATYSVLEVVPPIGRPRRLYVNQTTWRIDRATTRRDQLDVVIEFSDYRPIGGRWVPFHQTTRTPGMPANDIAVAVDSVWTNSETPPSRFALPGATPQDARFLKTPGRARLPFGYWNRHVWLRVSVNGAEPADFLYDTGASITVIDSAFAARMRLTTEGLAQGLGAGATGQASFARLDSLRVLAADGDGIAITGQKVAVLSINPLLAPHFWRDCGGILGYDVLSRFVNQIDYDARTLLLWEPGAFRPPAGATSIPFTLAGTVPAIRFTLDGEFEGEARVDVGSGSTIDLHGPFVERHDLSRRVGRTVEVMSGGFGGTFTSRIGRMKEIRIGPWSWREPLVSFSGAQAGALASEDYAGNIGNQLLERFHCAIDYERRLLWLSPGARYRARDGFSRAGMQLARLGGVVRAVQILPGSPAAAAGFQEEDAVESIDGKPALSYTSEALRVLFEEGRVGRRVRFVVVREGARSTLVLTLREML